jgi:hypothetical protein
MFDYQKLADLYRDLANAYDKISSLSKQNELIKSLNDERYNTLDQQYKLSLNNNNYLTKALEESKDHIEELTIQIENLEIKLDEYDQREE